MQAYGKTQILGAGGYLPPQVIRSDELMDAIHSEEKFGVPKTWLTDTLGVVERRYASSNTLPSELALRAGEIAIEDSGIDANEIDLVLFCGIERDQNEPATAHTIQYQLAPNATCWDITSACHGFMSGLQTADALIGSGAARYALVVTGETSSRVSYEAMQMLDRADSTDIDTFNKIIGFLSLGDGGGAMILGPKANHDKGILYHASFSEGRHHRLCYYRYGTENEGGFDCQMLMKLISSRIILSHREHINDTYKNLGWKPSEVDKLITHQVGKKPIRLAAKHTGIHADKVTDTITNYGNLTSATIAINYWLYPPKPNEKILLLGAGSGYSISQWGIQA